MSAAQGVVGRRLWIAGRFQPGWLAWSRGRIAEIGRGVPRRSVRAALEDLGSRRVVPGFVDLLVHGHGGHDAGEADPAGLLAMAAALGRAGVTSAWCGLYPASGAELRRAARRWDALRALRGKPPVARLMGWHLEGPWIPAAMRGALPKAALGPPSAPAARRLLRDGGGWLRMVTLAPELAGARAAAALLLQAGVVPSVGHTEASLEDCEALASLGPLAVTHLGNRMPPLAARRPGPVGWALAGGPRWVGVIPDGVHVAAALLQALAGDPRLAARLMLTSDNLSHAGTAATSFRAGGKRLRRDGAVARDRQGALAGTLEPLPELVRARIAAGELDWAQAVRTACEVPGALAGGCGRLARGFRADLVALAPGDRVARVWIGGREVPARERA